MNPRDFADVQRLGGVRSKPLVRMIVADAGGFPLGIVTVEGYDYSAAGRIASKRYRLSVGQIELAPFDTASDEMRYRAAEKELAAAVALLDEMAKALR